MDFYKITLKVGDKFKTKYNKKADYIVQNLLEHVDNTIISASEINAFMTLCMNFIECHSVFSVSFIHNGNKGYSINMLLVDNCNVYIDVNFYEKDINTTMINDILSAMANAGLLYFIPGRISHE